MLDLVRKARVVKAFGMLAGDLRRTEQVFALEDALFAEAGPAHLARFSKAAFLQDPDVRPLLEARWLGPTPDLDVLARLPAGTLGHAFAKHMNDRGLRIDFYPPVAVKDDLTWVMARARQTHDLLHVLTGFDTDVVGEVGLQGFTIGQVRTAPISVAIIAAGLLGILRNEPARIEEVMARLAEGWEMGARAKLFLGVRFEELWDVPLEEVRARLGIVPVRPAFAARTSFGAIPARA